MRGGMLWDMLVILSVVALGVSAARQGVISPVGAAVGLFVLVALHATGRGRGRGLGHFVRLLFRLALPLCSLGLLMLVLSRGSPGSTAQIAAYVGILVIMLLGLYIMVRGAFRR